MPEVVPPSTPSLPEGLSTGDAAKRIEALLAAREDSGADSGTADPAKPVVADPAPKGAEGTAEEGSEPAPEGDEEGQQADGPVLPAGVTIDPETGELTIDPKKFTRKLKVDGQEVEQTLEEIEKSYSFQAHNTRTAQKNAEERRALETERVTLREDRERYAKILPQLEEIISQHVDPYANVDWERLRAEDPKAFAEHRAAYDLQRERLAKVKAERDRIEKEQAEEQQKVAVAYAESQRALLYEAIPDWTDDAKRTTELTDIARWAKQSLGLSDEDLGQVSTAWHYQVLRKAYLFDKLNQTADKAREKVAQVRATAAPPARAAAPKPKSATDRSLETLRQTGKVSDAAAALEARLNQRGTP